MGRFQHKQGVKCIGLLGASRDFIFLQHVPSRARSLAPAVKGGGKS